MGKLEEKVAIITGGGSGIGAAIARQFCSEGASVHLLDLNIDNARSLSIELSKKGMSCVAHECDVSNQPEVAKTFAKIFESNPVGILVNNAGIGFIGSCEQTTEEDLDRLYQVNIKGVYNCLYALIPHFKQFGGGVILNMASVAASVGLPDRFAYSMTKGAVLTMTYSIAVDYLDDNIRCNSISPARVHTPFVDAYLAKNYPGSEALEMARLSRTQPIGRMARPEEVAQLATYLCSDEAAFITGTDYPIDGGFLKLAHRLPLKDS